MSLRLQSQFLLTGAVGAILSLLLIFLIPGPDGLTGPGSIPADTVAILSGLLLLAGLPALYHAQAKQLGIPGLVGVLLLWVGMGLFLLVLSGVQLHDVALWSSIPKGVDGPPPLALISAILGGTLIVIGGAIVGITTLRAQVLAAAIGWSILISCVVFLLTFPVDGSLGNILHDGAIALVLASLAWAAVTLSSRVKLAQES
jgi:hypothetical protein